MSVKKRQRNNKVSIKEKFSSVFRFMAENISATIWNFIFKRKQNDTLKI